MELKGKIKEITYNKKGIPNLYIELERTKDINKIDEIEQEEIKIKITPVKNSRTLRQNNLLWQIITDIDIEQNAIPTEEGRWEIYTRAIEELGAEYEDIILDTKAIKMIKNKFRATKILAEKNGKTLIRCFIGSSNFNKKQMAQLIDYLLDQAQKLNIPIIDYTIEYQNIF